jgi:NAD kinase
MDSEVRVSVPEYDGKVFLTIDGQVSEPLFTGDSVVIRKANNTVRIVRSASKTYFAILRNKLNWGLGNKAE